MSRSCATRPLPPRRRVAGPPGAAVVVPDPAGRPQTVLAGPAGEDPGGGGEGEVLGQPKTNRHSRLLGRHLHNTVRLHVESLDSRQIAFRHPIDPHDQPVLRRSRADGSNLRGGASGAVPERPQAD